MPAKKSTRKKSPVVSRRNSAPLVIDCEPTALEFLVKNGTDEFLIESSAEELHALFHVGLVEGPDPDCSRFGEALKQKFDIPFSVSPTAAYRIADIAFIKFEEEKKSTDD